MLTVSEDTIYETTRAVVAESPDHVYEPPTDVPDVEPGMCLYVHSDGPGCVAGKVFHRLGISLDDLSIHEGQPAHRVMANFLTVTGNPDRAGRFLDEIQGKQDDGETWADALAHAEWYVPKEPVV